MKKNHTEEDVYILAIESSCDETAAAVVKNGREVLSNIISSQIVEKSCNGYFIRLGQQLGAESLLDAAKAFGFGQSLPLAEGFWRMNG